MSTGEDLKMQYGAPQGESVKTLNQNPGKFLVSHLIAHILSRVLTNILPHTFSTRSYLSLWIYSPFSPKYTWRKDEYIFTHPTDTGRMRHKINFQAEYSWFEFCFLFPWQTAVLRQKIPVCDTIYSFIANPTFLSPAICKLWGRLGSLTLVWQLV